MLFLASTRAGFAKPRPDLVHHAERHIRVKRRLQHGSCWFDNGRGALECASSLHYRFDSKGRKFIFGKVLFEHGTKFP